MNYETVRSESASLRLSHARRRVVASLVVTCVMFVSCDGNPKPEQSSPGQPDLSTSAARLAHDVAVMAFNHGNDAINEGEILLALKLWHEALIGFEQVAGTEREQAECCVNIGVS